MSTSGMGGGGRKSVNVELNLVPFIDLLSTLICFLLITAVWQEIDVVSSSAPPKSTAEAPDKPQPRPLDEKKKVMLTIALGVDKTDVAEDEKITAIPHVMGEPDITRITATLHDWKVKYPDRKDLIFATDNKAKYKHLVQLMDVFNTNDFPDVGINLN